MSEPRKILDICALCPGICVTECPVYMSTHIRASAPNNLARIALKFMDGKEDMEEALWLCTGCRLCEYACPLGNRLWEAVRILRKTEHINVGVRIEKIADNSKPGLLIVSSSKPGANVINLLRGNYSLYWVDSRAISGIYWNGGSPELGLNGIDALLPDDMDALTPLLTFKKHLVSPLRILKSLGVRRLLGDNSYVLHVPCKTPKEYRDTVMTDAPLVLGTPDFIVEGCVAGGGGLSLKHPSLAREVAMHTMHNVDPRKPVITLCSNARVILNELGYHSLTLLDLIEEVA